MEVWWTNKMLPNLALDLVLEISYEKIKTVVLGQVTTPIKLM
jgi:hypothetical protein